MNGALVSVDRGGVFDMSFQAPIARPRLRERRCDVQETDPPAVATRSTARVAFRRRGEHLRPLPRAASQLKCGFASATIGMHRLGAPLQLISLTDNLPRLFRS